MNTDKSPTFILLGIFTLTIIAAGCLFTDELVSIDIYGPDQIPPNITRPDGLRVRINNDSDQDLNDMRVQITVPERIYFAGSPGGRPLNVTKGLEWVYSFTTSVKTGAVTEFQFSYMAEIYEAEFQGGNEFSFDIDVEVFDNNGTLIGSQMTTWRVTK